MQNEANFHSCLPAGGILQIRQETLVSGPNYLILVLDFWFLGVPGLAIFCPFSSLENLEDYWYNNRENISLFVAAFHKLSFLCKAFASDSLFAVFLQFLLYCLCGLFSDLQFITQKYKFCSNLLTSASGNETAALCVLFLLALSNPTTPPHTTKIPQRSATFLFGFEVARKFDVLCSMWRL